MIALFVRIIIIKVILELVQHIKTTLIVELWNLLKLKMCVHIVKMDNQMEPLKPTIETQPTDALKELSITALLTSRTQPLEVDVDNVKLDMV